MPGGPLLDASLSLPAPGDRQRAVAPCRFRGAWCFVARREHRGLRVDWPGLYSLSPACFLPALVFRLLMGAARPDAQGRARHHSPCPLFSPCRLLRAARLGRDPPGRRTSERAPKPGPAPLPDSCSLSSSRTPALGAAAAVGSASSWSPRCPRRRRGAPPSPPTCSAPPTLSASPPAPWCKTRASHRSSKCGSGAGGAGGAAGTCAWGLDPGGPGAPPGHGWQARARCRTARATQAPGASSSCLPLVSGFPRPPPSLPHPPVSAPAACSGLCTTWCPRAP